jgi:hypothetical protein
VLFQKRFWAGLADGSITLTFRRWERPRVLAGRSYRSPAGILDVSAVDVVDPAAVTDAEAEAAGFPDAEALRADLPGDPAHPTFRIAFSLSSAPDPRAALAADDALDGDDLADITRRLDRLDRASSHGPWTRETLALIAERPAVRAPDLAAAVGRERDPFKLDVRKLKNLGLTESLAVGYRLSPRGQAYLTAMRETR